MIRKRSLWQSQLIGDDVRAGPAASFRARLVEVKVERT
jgi:hypothetical protein